MQLLTWKVEWQTPWMTFSSPAPARFCNTGGPSVCENYESPHAPTSTHQSERDEEIRKKWPQQQEQRKRETALFLVVAPTIENDKGHSAVLTLFLAATKEKRVEGKFHASLKQYSVATRKASEM
jgi:hypothetical protein